MAEASCVCIAVGDICQERTAALHAPQERRREPASEGVSQAGLHWHGRRVELGMGLTLKCAGTVGKYGLAPSGVREEVLCDTGEVRRLKVGRRHNTHRSTQSEAGAKCTLREPHPGSSTIRAGTGSSRYRAPRDWRTTLTVSSSALRVGVLGEVAVLLSLLRVRAFTCLPHEF